MSLLSLSIMKGYNRKCYAGILNHCYQRPRNGEVLFYSVSDYLVFFTIFCVAARKRGMKVLALSLMPDHVHHSTIADQKKDLSSFVRDYTSEFVREYNVLCRRKGPLFQTPFGSAPKIGDKKARSNLIYVGNNPSERKLCSKAEDYRWTFLAYAESCHPFSEKLVLSRARTAMRRAVAAVSAQFRSGRAMTYKLLQRLFKTLENNEKEQLVDYIISLYNVIDYKEAIRFFDTYEDMIHSMHATTGSEHDINEIFVGKSDAVYSKFTRILFRDLHLKDIHDVFKLSEEKRSQLAQHLQAQTGAPAKQINKYLHL